MSIMRSILTGAVCLAGALACHNQRSAPAAAPGVEVLPSVFTDSALHVERCQPLRAGEDWRKVCTPKDQSAPPQVVPKKR